MRSLFGPVFFLGFIGLAVFMISHGVALGWLPALLVVAIVLSYAFEKRWPYQVNWNKSQKDTARDYTHAAVNETFNVLGVAAIPLLAMWLPDRELWPKDWPLGFQFLLVLPIADLGITLVHYASHRWPLLWRLHAVHHSVTRMYGFNGLMKHPLHQMLEALGGTLPLLLLGMPLEVAALLAFAIAIQLLLQHSNVDMRIGWLRYIFAWAPLHRLHHLKYGTAGDVNFALFFSFWDRLLGTALDYRRYTVTDNDLGIGDRPDYPVAYLAQLVEPFRREQPAHPPAPVPATLREALIKDS